MIITTECEEMRTIFILNYNNKHFEKMFKLTKKKKSNDDNIVGLYHLREVP